MSQYGVVGIGEREKSPAIRLQNLTFIDIDVETCYTMI
jgi:hypothetical protein